MPYADPNAQRTFQKNLMRKRRAAGLEAERIRLVSFDEAGSDIGAQISRAWTNASFASDGIGLG